MTTDIKTIVALIALKEELAEFQKIFPFKADHSTETSVRLEHETGRDDIRLISILAEQMGAQSALLSANDAVIQFGPDLVVVIGIGGGISNDLQIGDVCVSNEIIDVLQNNKVIERDGKPEISFAPDFYSVDADLVASFTFLQVHPQLVDKFAAWRKGVGTDHEYGNVSAYVRPSGPELILGPIACGPVVTSAGFTERLQALHRKVAVIETESGGVFGRLRSARIPAIAIRGVSDLADSDKAQLERETHGGARRYAMLAATALLKTQLENSKFIAVAERHRSLQAKDEGLLFPQPTPETNLIANLETEIRARLAERSPEFRAKPDSYYLPMPRARRLGIADDIDATSDSDIPSDLTDCLKRDRRIVVRLPRSYPSQALGWSLAYSLIRQQIGGKVVLPYVVEGSALNPPKLGLNAILPRGMGEADPTQYQKVIIIEEPPFHARNRMAFIAAELERYDPFVLIITKTEDAVAEADTFFKNNNFKEYQVSGISFEETAFFLEKSFDMPPHEAEAVAIRLDDTFRKFRLDAHPTYFAGIQEETLAALINANKRAELIQLAVDSLLTMIVAADKATTPLSRTTREAFLRQLAIEETQKDSKVSEVDVIKLADRFITEKMFPNSATEFLAPFFAMGLLYRADGHVFFTHPYLESYLVAQAVRDRPDLADGFFNPYNSTFNYYAFDLYCELGPKASVIDAVAKFAADTADRAERVYGREHIYVSNEHTLAALSSPRQLQGLTAGLLARAEKMEGENHEGMRSEKQRILDTKRYVKSEVRNLKMSDEPVVSPEIQAEFDVLDDLARALSLAATAVGAGSESLSGSTKRLLGSLVLRVGHHFSDTWTRNRFRFDFSKMRNDLLSDDNIWSMVKEMDADDAQFDSIRKDVELFIHGFELNAMAEPMGRVLWRITNAAGAKVLLPVIDSLAPNGQIESMIRSAWTIELDPEKGRDSFKASLRQYSGTPLFRIVLASHLLWRVFWHHYKSRGATHFVNSARRALRPLGMAPSDNRLEQVKKGSDHN